MNFKPSIERFTVFLRLMTVTRFGSRLKRYIALGAVFSVGAAMATDSNERSS